MSINDRSNNIKPFIWANQRRITSYCYVIDKLEENSRIRHKQMTRKRSEKYLDFGEFFDVGEALTILENISFQKSRNSNSK